jgi:hypothetical protein
MTSKLQIAGELQKIEVEIETKARKQRQEHIRQRSCLSIFETMELSCLGERLVIHNGRVRTSLRLLQPNLIQCFLAGRVEERGSRTNMWRGDCN